MTNATAGQIISELQQPKPQDIDLGPMRLIDSGTTWDNGSKKHILTIRAGSTVISIISSPSGSSVYVIKDGVRLSEPAADLHE